LADSPTRRRGKKSLLIRRDTTLRISGALHLGIFDQPEKNEFSDRLLKCESASSTSLNNFLSEIISFFNLSETLLTGNNCGLSLISLISSWRTPV
jgi:hypothetical protein